MTIHLPETTSTNLWLRAHAEEFSSEGLTVVWADHQTAGRGCGTNTWESTPGQNLLFSVLCHPKDIPATQQFLLLEAMALAVKTILDFCLPKGEELKIKWPNDIYWRDRKLGGTLTECAVSGQNMRWCIIGTGVNVNQTEFSPQLPNPVSLKQITGNMQQPESLLQRITSCFAHRLHIHGMGHASENHPFGQTEMDLMHKEYMSALYRRHGYYPFRDQHGSFEAEIVSVAPDGTLTLRDRLQRLRHYKFKEVEYVIGSN